MNTAFGTALALERKRKGMTQRYFAHQVNEITGGKMKIQHVSNWERGEPSSNHPGPETIVAIAQVLDADPVRLCFLAGKIHPEITDALLNDERFAESVYNLAIAYRCHECGSLPGYHTKDCQAIN